MRRTTAAFPRPAKIFRSSRTESAYAKVNWYLRICGKRPDGYHDLETLFVRLQLADQVVLTSRPSGVRLVTHANLPKGPKNLAYHAAQILQRESCFPGGVEIRLKKRIPVEAGLGGGSSDAAAVLLGLNKLWRLGWTREQLAQLGAQLGSDVAFFVSGRRFAVGRGRGERLTPVRSSKRFWHVLIKPPFGISTREAYGEYARLARSTRRDRAFLTPPRGGVNILVRFLQNRQGKRLPGPLFNSLEVALNKRLTIISKIKDSLIEQGAQASLLSGSGSAVFGVFLSRRSAQKAAGNLRRQWASCRVLIG